MAGNLIVAGRPGMGKTAFALDVARHVALREGGSVGIFSLEMSVEELTLRLIAAETGIPFASVRAGREVYHPDDLGNRGIAELILAKQRNGETGTVELAWRREITSFGNLARERVGRHSPACSPYLPDSIDVRFLSTTGSSSILSAV